MNDHAELSLAVARIMWPEYEWALGANWAMRRTVASDRRPLTDTSGDPYYIVFDYRTDDAGFKMAVWLANNEEPDSWEIGWLRDALEQDNPHRALAEAVKEIGNG